MTKNKKIVLAITIPIAVIMIATMCLLLVFGIDILKDAYAHRGWTEIDYCNDRWDVAIPKATIEYTYSDRGWFGDGETYTVCQYSSRPNELLKEFKADSDGKNLEKYNTVINLLQSSSIDRDKLVAPDENYIWFSKVKNSNNTLLLAYNQQTNKLYIIEDFM